MSIKNKRILITAGPTWVPIDSVRVISNIASGETGILLAKEAQARGFKVTLLLGPAGDCCIAKGIRVVRYKFFSELEDVLNKELRSGKYDAMVHSAAVSDYQPARISAGKICSDLKSLTLKLLPTPKLINAVKKINPGLFLVGFKFLPDAHKNALILAARELIAQSSSDLVVANTVSSKKYSAYLVDADTIKGKVGSKANLIRALVKEIGSHI